MLFSQNLELASAVALEPRLDSREPGVQLPEEGTRWCLVHYDHNVGTWKGGWCMKTTMSGVHG